MQYNMETNQKCARKEPFSASNQILSERVVEHEVVVPKRVLREEVIEKMIVVPETIVREEIVEEVQTVRERIIEIAKPIIHEKIVEIPEVEYRDKIIEVVEKVKQEKIVEVPKIIYQDRYIEVPKIITQEKIVEVPNIEYQEEIIEKIVEVPEVREQVLLKKLTVPQYVEYEPEATVITCKVPVPVECSKQYTYTKSHFVTHPKKVPYTIYAPRFIQVPVPAELYTTSELADMQRIQNNLQSLNGDQAVELCQLEGIKSLIQNTDLKPKGIHQASLTDAWNTGLFQVVNSHPISIS